MSSQYIIDLISHFIITNLLRENLTNNNGQPFLYNNLNNQSYNTTSCNDIYQLRHNNKIMIKRNNVSDIDNIDLHQLQIEKSLKKRKENINKFLCNYRLKRAIVKEDNNNINSSDINNIMDNNININDSNINKKDTNKDINTENK